MVWLKRSGILKNPKGQADMFSFRLLLLGSERYFQTSKETIILFFSSSSSSSSSSFCCFWGVFLVQLFMWTGRLWGLLTLVSVYGLGE